MSEPKTVTLTLVPGHCDWKSVVEWLRNPGYTTHNFIADQIEAQLPKLKPDEPKNLGAVVEANGRLWVREAWGWLQLGKFERDLVQWEDLDDVTVFFEGAK